MQHQSIDVIGETLRREKQQQNFEEQVEGHKRTATCQEKQNQERQGEGDKRTTTNQEEQQSERQGENDREVATNEEQQQSEGQNEGDKEATTNEEDKSRSEADELPECLREGLEGSEDEDIFCFKDTRFKSREAESEIWCQFTVASAAIGASAATGGAAASAAIGGVAAAA